MASLLEIAPLYEVVTVRGRPVEVYGITARALPPLVRRFPRLKALAEGNRLEASDIIEMAGDAVGPIIAAGIGKPGDPAEEEAASRLTLGEQADILVAIRNLTMPDGLVPFAQKLSRLVGSIDESEKPNSDVSAPAAPVAASSPSSPTAFQP
jgi:hypothetical protein